MERTAQGMKTCVKRTQSGERLIVTRYKSDVSDSPYSTKAPEYLLQMELRFPFLFCMSEVGKLPHLLQIMLFIQSTRLHHFVPRTCTSRRFDRARHRHGFAY